MTMAEKLFPLSGKATTLGKISNKIAEIEQIIKDDSSHDEFDFSKLTNKQVADLKSALGIK